MTESWFRREFLTPRRLVFNVLFYGLQLSFFAYGWFAQVSRDCLSRSSLPHGSSFVNPGNQQEVGRAQCPDLVRLGVPWCWSCPRIPRRMCPAPHAA